ncbi:MAG TPA: TetR family transcriptional regulator C-terminal domain-containing protein [Kiloniellales bacterium]|nr:TetR family transcriptional regulator C-terminal domain-containing protein [Kiloniellales bacterium]
MAVPLKETKTVIARRQDLIHGTIRSIAKRGFANSTVQTICEAAGLSRGLIGHYFRSKDELLLAAFRSLVTEADAETRRAIRDVADPLERLIAATRVSFERAEDREKATVWLAFWGTARWTPKMNRLNHHLYARYRRWVQRQLGQAAAARGVELDTRRTALMYAQMIDGFSLGLIMDPDAYTPKEAAAIICDWLRSLFAGGAPPRHART